VSKIRAAADSAAVSNAELQRVEAGGGLRLPSWRCQVLRQGGHRQYDMPRVAFRPTAKFEAIDLSATPSINRIWCFLFPCSKRLPNVGHPVAKDLKNPKFCGRLGFRLRTEESGSRVKVA
jgi:hypothetical protein